MTFVREHWRVLLGAAILEVLFLLGGFAVPSESGAKENAPFALLLWSNVAEIVHYPITVVARLEGMVEFGQACGDVCLVAAILITLGWTYAVAFSFVCLSAEAVRAILKQ